MLNKVNSKASLYSNVEIIKKILNGYFTKIDILRSNATISGWSLDYSLSGFTYENLNTEGSYHIFSLSLPSSYTHSLNNALYYSIFNIKYLKAKYLGNIVPEDVVYSDSSDYIEWGYDASKLYLLIASSGKDEYKYLFWLPKTYSVQEKNYFFNVVHTFSLDYATS